MGLLEAKTIIVTGAGRGVGRAHALFCAAQGARVVVNDLGVAVDGSGAARAPADEVVALIRARGGEAVADYHDISDWTESEATIRTAIEHFGDLDGLVNNAGVIRSPALPDATEDDFDIVTRVHLKGTFACSRHACHYWREEHLAGVHRPRSIVNTVSDAMLFILPRPIYGATKAAIAHLTLSASQDSAAYLTRMNAIAPRAFTRMSMASAQMVYAPDSKPPEAEEYTQDSPVNPSNSSPLVAWLLSDEAQHVSGQVFRTLAGAFARCFPWHEGDLQWPADGAQAFNADEIGRAMNRGVFGSQFVGRQLDFAPGDTRQQRPRTG